MPGSLEAILRSVDTSLADYLRKDQAVLDIIPDGEVYARVRREIVNQGLVTALYAASMGSLIPADALVWLGMFGNGGDGDYMGGSLDLARAVWEFARFELPAGQNLTVAPLTIIRSQGDVIIDGTLTVKNWGDISRPGQPGYGISGGTSGEFFEGGGGGGGGGAGGDGGRSNWQPQTQGGPAIPVGFFFPAGGGAGGASGKKDDTTATDCLGGYGGVGGGALMIVAKGNIIIRGSIICNGASGTNATTTGGVAPAAGGGGGGAGGTVLLRSAAGVVISGTISARGGSGRNGVTAVSTRQAGGGGGGGGGTVHVIARKVDSAGTVDVSGGAAGLGTQSSYNGFAGSTGQVIIEVRDLFPFLAEQLKI